MHPFTIEPQPPMQKLFFLFFSFVLMLLTNTAKAQLIVPFTQRPSSVTPDQLIYKVRGDFQMIGNTNLTLLNYTENGSNNNFMAYVDEDNDSSTWNSSMAQLILPLENNADPKCNNIIYAGLYWTARAHINDIESPVIFESTNESGETKLFNKRQIKIKGPLSNVYSTITANENDIYYPIMAHGKMYSAYAEITNYVKQQGVGNYWVADLAVLQGQSDPTGLYGGWSMVVVYENPQMNWRDITIFDGHSYVAGSITADFEIPIEGFQTSLSGPIDLRLGVITGEGDRNIAGDYLEIRNHEDTEWLRLSHDNNSINNFFNSSIFVGNANRQPNLLNNTGLDISMFQIPNPNNSVITNNQTSTRFRYGTTQDTFIILNLTMSVNTYVSETQEVANVIEINNQPAPPLNEIAINPGDEITYQINIYNIGNEAVNEYKFQTNIPAYTELIQESIQTNVFFNQNPLPNSIEIDQSVGNNGAIIWDYGQLFFPDNPEDIIASILFKVKVKSGCYVVPSTECLDQIVLSGSSSGVGDISLLNLENQALTIGFNALNECLISPIYGQLILEINPEYEIDECFENLRMCVTDKPTDLMNLLPPKWQQNGVWIDENNSGALSNTIFIPSNANLGNYYIFYEIFNDKDCLIRYKFKIEVHDDCICYPPNIEITPPNCKDFSLVFIADFDASLTYIFSPSGPTVNSNGQIIGAMPLVNYTVYSTDANCTSDLSEFFFISPPEEPISLEFFNYLSPNNDGKNDSFNIKNYDTFCYQTNILQIFNRWGALVFEKENYLHDAIRFDGFTNVKNTVSSKDNLPEGTYFYIFRYQMLDNNWREKNGWLYLNRP